MHLCHHHWLQSPNLRCRSHQTKSLADKDSFTERCAWQYLMAKVNSIMTFIHAVDYKILHDNQPKLF